MKNLMKSIGLMLLWLAIATGAKASPLSDSDQSFVIAVSASAIVAAKCSTTMVPSSAIKLADKLGVHADVLYPAIMAAVKANANMPYEHSDMIPEVTNLLVHTMLEISGGLARDPAATCAKWVGGLRMMGMVQ